MSAAAIVPAAGKGERFGGAKLLALIDGEPLLERTLRSLLDAGLAELIVVTAPGADFSAVRLIADARVRVIQNPDPSRGMFSSIRQGLEEAVGADPILVLPADMPFVRSETAASVIRACERTSQIVLPTYRGKHGHPIGFPAAIRADVLASPFDSTLKAALALTGVDHFELNVDDPGILRDVDVRQDL